MFLPLIALISFITVAVLFIAFLARRKARDQGNRPIR